MKKKVLFIGSFIEKAKDGSVGGQMYACRSLVASQLSENIEWILLDTTGESVPPPPVYVRLLFAIKRLFKFIYYLIVCRPKTVLVFTANSPSIIEKGVMIIIASFFVNNVIIAPRGGPLDKEIENNKWLRSFVKFVFKRANHVICQGKYWKTFFSNLVDIKYSEKFVVIPNWIDKERYNLKPFVRKNSNVLNILYMGWIQEDKGIHDIFSALEFIKLPTEEVVFNFLGDGPARNHFIEVCKSGKYPFYFNFPGWVHGDGKLKFLANADIFVLASHSEGLPNSLMEAMLCGVPSIATDVGSVSDLIINNETGVLVTKKNIPQLAEGFTKLMTDIDFRNKISKNAQKRILENHSIESAVEKFRQII